MKMSFYPITSVNRCSKEHWLTDHAYNVIHILSLDTLVADSCCLSSFGAGEPTRTILSFTALGNIILDWYLSPFCLLSHSEFLEDHHLGLLLAVIHGCNVLPRPCIGQLLDGLVVASSFVGLRIEKRFIYGKDCDSTCFEGFHHIVESSAWH